MNRILLRVLTGSVICAVSTPALAKPQTPLPEHLLTPADFERIGLKGIVRQPAEMSDPKEGLQFARASESALVLTLAALPRVGTSAELRSAMASMGSEVTRVSGVGDEAYAGMGGFLLMFRKGATAFQLLTNADDSGEKPYVTAAQLAELAKIVATRASTVATVVTEGQAPTMPGRPVVSPPAPAYPGATFDAQTSRGMSSSGPDSFFVYMTSDPAVKVVAFYQTKTGKQAQKIEEGSFAFFLSGGGLPDLTVQSNLIGPYAGKTVITIVKHWR